ncbi:MAG: hypothetical protein OEM41_04975 [Ignavibacteria bacterium]|nr:hypothetical protein [Ignavibacteria bacterium]
MRKKTSGSAELLWAFGATGILAYGVFVTSVSPTLSFSAQPSHHLVLLFVAVRILVGVLFVVCMLNVARVPDTRTSIAVIIGVGLAVRVVLLFSEPVLEDDYNRYIWDGALAAHGVNPFRYSPEEMVEGRGDSGSPEMSGPDAGPVVEGINHPHIRTIYPPFAQAVFAAAYLLSPWKLWGWKLLILIADSLVVLLVLRLLRLLDLPSPLAAVYWWNPILIHEFSNALHMDVLVLPPVLAALILVLRAKTTAGVSVLALASGFKVWPALLLPLFTRRSAGVKRERLKLFVLASVIVVLVFTPVLVTPLDESLGFVKYASSWTNNQALFTVLHWVVSGVSAPFTVSHDLALGMTRVLSSVLIIGIALRLARRPILNAPDMVRRMLLTVAWLFFLSPTQFPWYYTWMVPLLALWPSPALLMYAVTLPLFQLVYRWEFLVWIQHIPVFLLFLWEITSGKTFSGLRTGNHAGSV